MRQDSNYRNFRSLYESASEKLIIDFLFIWKVMQNEKCKFIEIQFALAFIFIRSILKEIDKITPDAITSQPWEMGYKFC